MTFSLKEMLVVERNEEEKSGLHFFFFKQCHSAVPRLAFSPVFKVDLHLFSKATF